MENYSDELDTVNNTLALTLLPVIVVISIYMVIGLIGNPLVAIYYLSVAIATRTKPDEILAK
jgi:hypothetical protein